MFDTCFLVTLSTLSHISCYSGVLQHGFGDHELYSERSQEATCPQGRPLNQHKVYRGTLGHDLTRIIAAQSRPNTPLPTHEVSLHDLLVG
jgi:hypothetical protein